MNNFEYLGKRYDEPLNLKRQSLHGHGVPMSPGDQLPNGAIILVQRNIRIMDHRMDALVLAVSKGHHPFVSWVRTLTTDSPLATGGFHIVDTTSWGEYDSNIDSAVIAFWERLEKKRTMIEETGELKEVNA